MTYPDGRNAKWWDIEVRPDRPVPESVVRCIRRAAEHDISGHVGQDGAIGQLEPRWPSAEDVAEFLSRFRGLSGRFRLGYRGQHCPGFPECAGCDPGDVTCFVPSNAGCCPPDLSRAEWLRFENGKMAGT